MKAPSFGKTLSRLTDTGLWLMFAVSLAFAALTLFFSLPLGLGELAAALLLGLALYRGTGRRRKAELLRLESMVSNVDFASRRTMLTSPFPMLIFRPDSDEIIWTNQRFLRVTGDQDHIFETSVSTLLPGFSSQWLLEGKHLAGEPVQVGEHYYLVYGSLSSGEDQNLMLATTYWVDITRYASVDDLFQKTRPVFGFLQVDNYDDLGRGLGDAERSTLRNNINERISHWLEPHRGLLCRSDRDSYIFFLETQSLQALQRTKFALLDEIRHIQSPNGVAATLSIGIGLNAPDPLTLFQYASMALDMALSRGGDQVVLKNGESFSFVGGRSKETERRTKVKSRVMASALSELTRSAGRVLVMGHKFPDLDVVGAVAGVCAIARKLGVPVYAAKAPSPYPGEVMAKSLAALPEYKGILLSPDELRRMATPGDLLVVVDTNRPEQVQIPRLLEVCQRIVVIDHHRRAASYIEKPALSFHDPYASSACELVGELVQYILDSGDLLRTEAEALLSGIVLDTKGFTMRTGSRTFEIAAFLRKSGADTVLVNKHFQNSLPELVDKFAIIQTAETYRGSMAIAAATKRVGRIIAGQAADQLLNIAGVDASFVLFPEDGQTYLSARSSGDVNVQVITEMLGGGGNAAAAGAQFPALTVDQVLPKLKETIDAYFSDES